MRGGVLTIFVFVLLSIGNASDGCEVKSDYQRPSLGERARAAAFVFEGTADTSAETLSSRYGRTTRVKVHSWLKGEGSSFEITLRRFGWGPDCLSPIPKESSIFFANRLGSEDYILNYVGVLDAVEPATTSNVSEILKALAER